MTELLTKRQIATELEMAYARVDSAMNSLRKRGEPLAYSQHAAGNKGHYDPAIIPLIKAYHENAGTRTPKNIQRWGAEGARQQALADTAKRLTAALERRERPERYIGPCRHPGCDRPAIIGRHCANPRHYCQYGSTAGMED